MLTLYMILQIEGVGVGAWTTLLLCQIKLFTLISLKSFFISSLLLHLHLSGLLTI
jgi:hypothetical protein